MPSITPQVFPTLFNVRVDVNWSDVPQATYVTVWRVDCVTGERTQLRPYVAYNGNGYLLLSCGQAVFWDTEAPLDTCFYYCTTAQDDSGADIQTAVSPVVFDDFNRVNVDTWNTATSGQTWVLSAAAADYDVNGSFGTIASPSIAVRNATISTSSNLTRAQVSTAVSQVATGDTLFNALCVGTDSNNLYMARLQFRTDSTARLELVKRVGGVQTTLASAVTIDGLYVANTFFTIALEVYPGSLVRAKAWLMTDPEPSAWTHSVADSDLSSIPNLILRYQAGAANTNVNPLSLWENASAGDVCTETEVIESCTEELEIESNGSNMLRDPVRPCHDRRVDLCWTADPNCVPGEGIFFQRLDLENYPNRGSNLNPVNSRRPVPVVRQRGDAESALTLVTRTFDDRDDVLTLAEPGSPLLWQSPPEYGMPDRYMAVGNLTVERYQEDHRYQPRRITLPFVTVDRPEGPSQGVCGARVDDLCDVYNTWDEIEAAGLTWLDLLWGAASTDIPATGERVWDDVNSTYANWNAVNAGNTDWEDVRDGP